MDKLPPEIDYEIAEICDFPSLVHLLSVSRKWRRTARYTLFRKDSLDFGKELLEVFSIEPLESHANRVEDFLLFLYQFGHSIKKVKINNPNLKMSCSDFILMARALPLLEEIEIEQSDLPQVSYDALYSLCFFKNLKHLGLKGWNQFNCAGRGSSYRSTLPYGHFLSLESLTIHGTSTVLDFLVNIASFTSKMDKLTSIEFIFTEESDKSTQLLSQFLIIHEDLSSIVLENLRFKLPTQVESFLRLFCHMKDLKELEMNSFEFPLELDSIIVDKFVERMGKKKVFLQVR